MSLPALNALFSMPDLTEETLTPDIGTRTLRERARRQFANRMKEEAVESVITHLPEDGESIHILSNTFDAFTLWSRAIDLTGERIEEMTITTWTINREYTNTIMEWLDSGRVARLSMLTGLYFKSREAGLYAYLAERMKARAMPFKAIEIHTKVSLARTASGRCLIMEGSANFTGNPRYEQNTITQSRELYEFYRDAFADLFNPRAA